MRKTIAAVTAGLLLVAGQSAAANDAAVSRVGDRVGARVGGESSEFAGVPIFALVIGAAVLITTVMVATDDSAESD